MRDMDNNYIGKSDNIDTQRLCLKVTLRVVSTVYPRDKTVTAAAQQAIADEFMVNPLPRRD